jgi:salicylate hydroxylase
MTLHVSIAGGGIGGLAAAFACARAGCAVQVSEQARAFSEAGAGIQLGPNVTRVLDAWGLGDALRRVASRPAALVVRDAVQGRDLARLQLGDTFAARYGFPYLTIHRADLQALLLDAARSAGVDLRLDTRVSGMPAEADAFIAADGVWSALRSQVIADGPARPSGHVAFRSLVPQAALPADLRRTDVNLWLGPRTHVVSYPVRHGEELNVVALVEAPGHGATQGWDDDGRASDLLRAIGRADASLRALIEAMPSWGAWSLHERPPVAGPQEMARGRVALLGDAAHPMLPYLAQGAGMAIEDADVLAQELANSSRDATPAALARYAQARWRRCAQVQAAARRNAAIFHASGPLRWGRDLAMRALGERLLDQPWLYR